MPGPAGRVAHGRGRVKELADYLLFVGEARRSSRSRRGRASPSTSRHARRGTGTADRSPSWTWRRRLLRYSCSYMVYAEAFDGLPSTVKDAVYRRMFAILSGKAGARYAYLTPADRRAVRQILRETKQDLPRDLR